MKLKTGLLFILAMLLLAASDPLRGKIKSIHMDQWPDTLIYQYDKEGRLISLTTEKGFKTTYEYKGNTIIAETKGGSHVTMFLNSLGLVDSLTDIDTNRKITLTPQEGLPDNEMLSLGISRSFPYSGNHVLQMDEIAGVTTHGILSLSKKYYYDENGFIKQEIVYLKAKGNKLRQIIASTEVRDGNIVSYSVKYAIDTIQVRNPKTGEFETKIVRQGDFTVKNTFDPNTKNTLAINPFWGKSSKNLMQCSVKYSLLPGVPQDSDVTTFKYTFDLQGRVSTLITKVQTNDRRKKRFIPKGQIAVLLLIIKS